MLKYN